MKILILLFTSLAVAWSQPMLHVGEIDGAKYKILAAEKPSGKVLLLAHGYRAKDAPLSADFDLKGVMAKTLVGEGWTIASTSYRRNGWIIDDALKDLQSLQKKVIGIQGKPTTTYILGNSMGAQIAVLAAEGALEIDGAITTGAALQNYVTPGLNPNLTYAPKIPLVLLINKEVNRPMSVNYHKKAGDKHCALWKIERLGHCNVSDLEKVAAVRALEDWNAGKKVERQKDATIAITDQPSTASVALVGKVTSINAAWGNLMTSYVAADLKTLGVKLKDELIVSVGSKSQTVILAEHYSVVPKGMGVAYITPEGYLQVMIFSGRMADKLGVTKTGSPLTLSKAR